MITWNAETVANFQEIVDDQAAKDTTLTAYFKANVLYPEARDLLYLLRPGPNGSELPKMSPERAGTWPQLMCCASVLLLSLICRETKERV